VLGHLGNRHSLRDIEAALATQQPQHYHLNIGNVSRSALARANEKLDPDFYQQLFYKLWVLNWVADVRIDLGCSRNRP
jgi:putative transposase